MTTTPPRIDLDAAYRPVPRLTVVPVLDEAAVYDRRNGRLHRLDPIATLVWAGLDGRISVRRLAQELATAFAAPVNQVTGDVVRLLEELVTQELVTTASEAVEETRDGSADADEEDGEPPPRSGEVQVLHVKQTLCYDAVAALGWNATDALIVGGFALGIRTSDPATRQMVRSALPAASWSDGLPVDANVSVRAPLGTGRTLELGRVYAGCTLVGRGRTTEELLDRTWREAAGLVLHSGGHSLACEVTVLEGTRGLLLAPGSWWSRLASHEAALRAAGLRMRDRHAVLGTGEHDGRLGLATLGSSGTIVFEWLGPVVAVTVGRDTLGGQVSDSPATRLAGVAAVLSPASGAAPSQVLEASALLAADAELVPAVTPEELLASLRG